MAHKAIIIIILSISVLLSGRCFAQTVVADMKSHLPVGGAKISTGNGREAITDHRGHFRIAPHQGVATVSCRGYMQRRVSAAALASDTIFLIPLINMLPEVEVTTSPNARMDIAEMVRKAAASAACPPSGVSFDFFSLFDRSVRHVSRKEREKQKRILEKY